MLTVLLSCIFLLFSNFMVFLLPSFLIMTHFFTSSFWKELTMHLGIKQKLSTAFHPQMDSQMEWVNQCVEQYLWNFCSYQQDNWVEWIGLAEFQYNNLIHDTTCTSLFYTNFSFHPTFSITPICTSNIPAASNSLLHLSTIHSELQTELKLAQDIAK